MFPSQIRLPEDVIIQLDEVQPGIYVDSTAYTGVEEYFPGRLLRIIGSYQIAQPPFTEDQIHSLNSYQKEALVREELREFRCPNCDDSTNIQAEEDGLHCLACNTVRDWVPKSLANWKNG